MRKAPFYGRRALAAAEAYIAHAEQLLVAQRQVLEGLVAAGQDTRRAAMILKLTEERLEQRRISRKYLLKTKAEETGTAL